MSKAPPSLAIRSRLIGAGVLAVNGLRYACVLLRAPALERMAVAESGCASGPEPRKRRARPA